MIQSRRFPFTATLVRAGLLFAVLSIFAVTARTAAAQSMAGPAYFYPGSYWTQLDQAKSSVGLAVMNPDSGPGSG